MGWRGVRHERGWHWRAMLLKAGAWSVYFQGLMFALANVAVPYIPTAQFILPTAYRTNLTGVIIAPVTFMWNVEKR